jgi:hypothetical protein
MSTPLHLTGTETIMFARLLRIVGWGWIWVAAAVIVVSYASLWYRNGFFAVAEMLSPFNVLNWIVTVATLAPGLVLLRLAERLGQAPGRS